MRCARVALLNVKSGVEPLTLFLTSNSLLVRICGKSIEPSASSLMLAAQKYNYTYTNIIKTLPTIGLWIEVHNF